VLFWRGGDGGTRSPEHQAHLYTSLAVRLAAVSERPIWLAGCDRLAAADLLGHVFACLLWIVVTRGGDAFFLAFVPAAKAASGAYEEGDRGHAHHHQSLARGIGAVALGGLC
jgi:hypothetical protein